MMVLLTVYRLDDAFGVVPWQPGKRIYSFIFSQIHRGALQVGYAVHGG